MTIRTYVTIPYHLEECDTAMPAKKRHREKERGFRVRTHVRGKRETGGGSVGKNTTSRTYLRKSYGLSQGGLFRAFVGRVAGTYSICTVSVTFGL